MTVSIYQPKSFLGPVARLLREAPVWGNLGADTLRKAARTHVRDRPTVAFLPATGPVASAYLRIYLIAAGLQKRGWGAFVIPSTLGLGQRRRLLAAMSPDVIVMQGARHDLNRPDMYSGAPIVFDMDDADFHLRHLADPVQQALPNVAAVMAGSGYIADWCRSHGARNVHVVWTGSKVSTPGAQIPHVHRPRRVAWAQTRPMTYTGEAEIVRRIIERVGLRLPGTILRLYDKTASDDPAFADSFRAPGVKVEWHQRCSYADYLQSMDDVAVGLAPLSASSPFSQGKSFGKILAYLDRRVPVVASDFGEPAKFFSHGTGFLGRDADEMAHETCKLLMFPGRRARMADFAYQRFRSQLSSQAACDRVERVLLDLISDDKRGVQK